MSSRIRIELFCKAGLLLGALSYLVFLLGHLGLLFPGYMAGSAALAAVFFAVLLFPGTRGRASSKEPFTLQEKLLFSAGVLTILLVVPLALTPPSVRDELIHHLAVPKIYLAGHRIAEIPFMGFSYLPQNIDLLYLIAMSLGSDVAPKLIHLSFAVATAGLVYVYLREQAGRGYALAGFVMYLSTPLVFNLSRTAYIDNGSAFYAALAMLCALKFDSDKSAGWIAWAGVATGLALGAKYNNLITALLLGLFIAYSASQGGRGAKGALKAGILYGAAAILVLSPWLIRNYIWTGGPFYPIFGAAMSAAMKGEGAHVTTEVAPMIKRHLLYGESTFQILLLPLRVFWEGADNSIQRFDGVLNPVFLILLPLAFLKKGPADKKYLAFFAFLFFLLAVFTIDLATRYLLPVFPAIVILAVFGLKNAFGSARMKMPGVALVIAFFIINIVYIGGLYMDIRPFEYLTGRETRGSYLERRLADYKVIESANKELPADAKVLMLFTGDRGYYWDRDYFYGDRLGEGLKDLVTMSKSPEELKEKFRAQGATHIFVNAGIFKRFAMDNFKKEDLENLSGFFNQHTDLLYSANGYSLFAIK